MERDASSRPLTGHLSSLNGGPVWLTATETLVSSGLMKTDDSPHRGQYQGTKKQKVEQIKTLKRSNWLLFEKLKNESCVACANAHFLDLPQKHRPFLLSPNTHPCIHMLTSP